MRGMMRSGVLGHGGRGVVWISLGQFKGKGRRGGGEKKKEVDRVEI